MPGDLMILFLMINIIVFSFAAADRDRKGMSYAAIPLLILFFWMGFSLTYLSHEAKLLEPELIANGTIQVVTYDYKVVSITKEIKRLLKEDEVVEMKTYQSSLWISWFDEPVITVKKE